MAIAVGSLTRPLRPRSSPGAAATFLKTIHFGATDSAGCKSPTERQVCHVCTNDIRADGHAAKFTYFGTMIGSTGVLDPAMILLAIVATIVGTSLARPMLEAMSDSAYRKWAARIIMAIASVYLARGSYLFIQ